MKNIKYISIFSLIAFFGLCFIVSAQMAGKGTSGSAKMNTDEAKQIAEKSGCVEEMQLTENVTYNENTKTWWIDLKGGKEGCNPACVINEDTKVAEINWRCTGALPNQGQVQTGIRTQNQGENSQNQEQNQEQQGQINAEQHRNTVTDFVQNLLQTADKDEGIGRQVRTIAQQQNQSASTTIQAMEKVQTRSKIKTFLFGSDYKNLGTLRSETVQTRNRLEQLNKVMENVQNEGDKTELQNQIQTLEQEQTKIENFIKAQESTFSLFGWLVKLFNK